MTKSWVINAAKSAVIISVIPAIIYGFRTGPGPGKTGAPGETTCWSIGCHQTGTGQFFPNSPSISIDFGGPNNYTPGAPARRWTVTIDDPQGVVFGFQLSTRVGADNSQAGVLSPIPGDSIRLLTANNVQYLEHTLPRNSNSFSFDWTPPTTNVGNVRVYVAVNAANNDLNNTGDRIHTANFTLPAEAAGAPPTISEGGVVNAWNFQPLIGEAAWVSIFGQNLAPTTRQWDDPDFVGGMLPTELDGVRVKVNNKEAAVFFISPGQLNVLAPTEASAGQVSIEVTTPDGTSAPRMVQKQAVAPALFTWAGVAHEQVLYVGSVFPDGSYVGKSGLLAHVGIGTRPAKPDEFVLLFATGCGPTDPPIPGDRIVTAPARLTSPVAIRIGGIPAEVFENTGFLTFAGLCQFNAKIPAAAPDGDLPLELEIGGVGTGQAVFITVERDSPITQPPPPENPEDPEDPEDPYYY